VPKILSDITRTLNNLIISKEIKGYYIQIKGRFQRGQRKVQFLKRHGLISLNNLNNKLKVNYGLLYTRFGIAGIKIIFCY
jgi:ribosomal protein S3